MSDVSRLLAEHVSFRCTSPPPSTTPTTSGSAGVFCATNWNALRHVGIETNARFLAALGEGQSRPPDPTTLQAVVLPSVTHDGLRAPAIRFGDPRAMALLASTAAFDHVVGELTNASLCRQMTGLYHPGYNPRRATYVTYDVSDAKVSSTASKAPTPTRSPPTAGPPPPSSPNSPHAPSSPPSPTSTTPPDPHPHTTAWRAYDKQIDALIARSGLPA